MATGAAIAKAADGESRLMASHVRPLQLLVSPVPVQAVLKACVSTIATHHIIVSVAEVGHQL